MCFQKHFIPFQFAFIIKTLQKLKDFDEQWVTSKIEFTGHENSWNGEAHLSSPLSFVIAVLSPIYETLNFHTKQTLFNSEVCSLGVVLYKEDKPQIRKTRSAEHRVMSVFIKDRVLRTKNTCNLTVFGQRA